MTVIIVLLVLLISFLIWFRPVLKREKELEGYADSKTKIIAVVYGLIPAGIVLFLCQIALGSLFKLIGIQEGTILLSALRAFIMYGVIEEMTKYGFARLSFRKYEKLKKVDVMVIFGLVGMGYEITETLIIGNIFAGIIRSVFLAHVMYQFIMGHYFFESLYAKNNGDVAKARTKLFLALFVPIIIHGINDFLAELISFTIKMEDYSSSTIGTATLGMILINVILIILNGGCLIWGLKLTKIDSEKEITL